MFMIRMYSYSCGSDCDTIDICKSLNLKVKNGKKNRNPK